jgi:hypothetical protein
MAFHPRVSTHSLRRYVAVTLGVGLFLAAQAAEAVTFSITEAVRTIGGGYGDDSTHGRNEKDGTLLDVKFTDSFLPLPRTFLWMSLTKLFHLSSAA